MLNITGINGTVGNMSELTVQYTDVDSSMVTVSLVGEEIPGLTLAPVGQSSVQVNWTPQSTDPVVIR